MSEKKSIPSNNIRTGQQDYPGVAIDAGDNNDISPRLVKEDVKNLNNNPRDTDM